MKILTQRLGSILLAIFSTMGIMLFIMLSIGGSFVFTDYAEAQSGSPGNLQELVPGFNYTDWYSQTTGEAPDDIYFGAYSLEAVGDELYLGFGTARPAESDGALLAVTNGELITAVSSLSEQGFMDMQAVDGTVYIPGTDPCCGDGWDFGNFYVKSPGQTITKYRNLPNVLHSWGVWFDEDQDILYTSVSSHLGDNQTWTGEVFSSTNHGADWVRVGNYLDGLGNYRTYDIIGFADRLYAMWNDASDTDPSLSYSCGLAMSDDAGFTWTRITNTDSQPLSCSSRLNVWQNKLLALSHDQKSVLVVAQDQQITEYPFVDFRISDRTSHPFAYDGLGYLYTFSEFGEILRTIDLIQWETVTETDLDLFSIAYWPARNEMVLSERGNGRLWTLDVTTTKPPAPQKPAKNIIIMITDGWGARHIAAANDYTDTTPMYQKWPRYWISTYSAGGSYNPQSAWTTFSYPLANPTDSAAAATALFTGVKTQNGRIAINTDIRERLFSISEKAQLLDKAVGTVSTVQISHATPGAWMSHNEARGNGYAIADEGLWGDPNTTGTVADDGRYGGGFGNSIPQDVVIGGGHPNWNTAYVNSNTRDKLNIESSFSNGFLFVERLDGNNDGGTRLLDAANLPTTTRLAGLFGGTSGNMEYRMADGTGHNLENPTLAEMTTASLTVLNRSPEGFVLMVEGGAVDWASHNNRMDEMLGELIGFNEAVQTVVDWVEDQGNGSNWDNTLVIITGDHETGYLTAAPGAFANRSLGTVNPATLALEKEVASTGLRASWVDGNVNNEIDSGERVYWAWNSKSHSNSLIPIYMYGVGAEQVARFANGYDPIRGAYLDNTEVFRLVDEAMSYRECKRSVQDGFWSDPSTWDSATAPTITDGVCINGGDTVTLNRNEQSRFIFIENEGALDLDAYNVTAEESVVNYGTLRQTLLVNASSEGNFMRIRNSANNADRYRGMDIATDASNDLGSITVHIMGNTAICNNPNSDGGIYRDRCFLADATNSGDATITLYTTSGEDDVFGAGDEAFFQWDSGIVWTQTAVCNAVPVELGNACQSSVTFGGPEYFLVGSITSSPLAVSLQSFSAVNHSNYLIILIVIVFLSIPVLLWWRMKNV